MNMYRKWSQIILYRIPVWILLFFCVYIAGVSLVTIANQEKRVVSSVQPVLFLFPGVVFFFFLIWFLCKKLNLLPAHLALPIGFLILFLGQLFLVLFVAKIYPITDSFRTLDEAAAMPFQNGLIDNQSGYYARYPNNYMFIVLMYYIFLAAKFFGIPYLSCAVALNIFLIDLTIFLGYFMVKDFFGLNRANHFLLLSVLCPITIFAIIGVLIYQMLSLSVLVYDYYK